MIWLCKLRLAWRCWTGWCGGHIEVDHEGVYWQCATCGKVIR